MARYLSIIESAYRATIEEQDDTAVWFSHAMKNGGAEISIVLRGDAVNYAVQSQDAKGLRFGSKAVKGPDLIRDLRAVIDKKIPLYVIGDDLTERGISASQLVPGIEQVPRSALARLVQEHDRVLYW